MAHPQVSALPPISASLAPRPANGPADMTAGADGEAQAFARVLAQKSNGSPREARSPAQDGPQPAKTPDSTGPAAKPQDGQAAAPTPAPAAPDRAAAGAEILAEAAALAAPLAATADHGLPELIPTEEVVTEGLVTEGSRDGADGPAPDALEASLAGIPAALAALMAGIAPGKGAMPSPEGVPAQASPETKLGEHFPGQGRRFLPASGAEAATGPAVVAGPETPALPAAAPEDAPEGFAAALASARPDKTPTVAAVDTPFGPASRASETAQAAANPAAGDAAAAPGPAAPHSPGVPNLHGAFPLSAAPAAQNHSGDSLLHIHIPQPPGHPAWAEAVGSRVSWMVGQRESTAELVLTPPQLGRVEVNLTVSGDQTTAQFVAATPAAREALEQALPRLREILAEAGINLADSGVSTSDRQDSGRQASRQNPGRLAGNLAPVEAGAKPGVAWGQTGRGLVDTFA